MSQKDQRNGQDRRGPSAINAQAPYLTKQGPILFDRRSGLDRRRSPADLEKADSSLPAQPAPALVE